MLKKNYLGVRHVVQLPIKPLYVVGDISLLWHLSPCTFSLVFTTHKGEVSSTLTTPAKKTGKSKL